MGTSPLLPRADRAAGRAEEAPGWPTRSAWSGVEPAQGSSLHGGPRASAPRVHGRHRAKARGLQTVTRGVCPPPASGSCSRHRSETVGEGASPPPRLPPSSRRWPLCSPQGPGAGSPGPGLLQRGVPSGKPSGTVSALFRELAENLPPSGAGLPPHLTRSTSEHGEAEPHRRKLQKQSQPCELSTVGAWLAPESPRK